MIKNSCENCGKLNPLTINRVKYHRLEDGLEFECVEIIKKKKSYLLSTGHALREYLYAYEDSDKNIYILNLSFKHKYLSIALFHKEDIDEAIEKGVKPIETSYSKLLCNEAKIEEILGKNGLHKHPVKVIKILSSHLMLIYIKTKLKCS